MCLRTVLIQFYGYIKFRFYQFKKEADVLRTFALPIKKLISKTPKSRVPHVKLYSTRKCFETVEIKAVRSHKEGSYS